MGNCTRPKAPSRYIDNSIIPTRARKAPQVFLKAPKDIFPGIEFQFKWKARPEISEKLGFHTPENQVRREAGIYGDALGHFRVHKWKQPNVVFFRFEMDMKNVVNHYFTMMNNNMKNCQSLTLYLTNCSDQGLALLCSRLCRNLTNLKHLEISFVSGATISNAGLTELAHEITSNLTKLTSLSLLFWSCKFDESAFSFLYSRIFRHQKQLKKLKLCCYGSENINGKDIKLTNIPLPSPNCIELRDLSLNFYGCIDLDFSVLAKLLLNLKNRATHLQVLSLGFSKCGEINDSGLIFIGDTIKELTNLRSISLQFERCSQITDQGLKDFANRIKTLTNLSELTLDFTFGKISDNCKNKALQDLAFISSVSIY